MLELINSLDNCLADEPHLRRMFGIWIRATLMRNTNYHLRLPEVQNLQELNIMLADKLEE